MDSVLRGRHVTLRQPNHDEIAFVHALWTDPETMDPVGGVVDYPPERMQQWFEYMVDPGGVEKSLLPHLKWY